jgi:CDP-diacylglycerol---glycerol-3-phosphate 3-phosphatidyltransferase
MIITPLSIESWHLYGLVAFWLSVAFTLISGLIYLIPAKTVS